MVTRYGNVLGGGDLNFHLKREKKFSEKIVQFIAAELVISMAYLHSRGIIYR
jgi:serine/threonine protein kinase